MNFECLSEGEVRSMYLAAKNKSKALQIISDLTLSIKREVAELLGVNYVAHRKRPDRRGCLDAEKCKALYGAGATDKELAQELGVSNTTIVRWRHIHELPPNGHGLAPRRVGAPRLSKIETRKIKYMELYKQGLQDAEIGKICGVQKSTVYHWRKQVGLPPNGARGGNRREKKDGAR